MQQQIIDYNAAQTEEYGKICELLASLIQKHLPKAEGKVWHRHPVWFLDSNPTVGYVIQKAGVRLMFWSGADFGEEGLNVLGQKFKDASIFFNHLSEVDEEALIRWLNKSKEIRWDYKNLIKRKGQLVKIGQYLFQFMNLVDQYIASFSPEVQTLLRQIRKLIISLAPDAEESMAYDMPAYKTYGKPLVYFAAFKHHIGFYATPTGHETFVTRLAAYKQGKGSVQFPLNKAIPYDLIEDIVQFRIEENKNSIKRKS
jgi:uncharacterized protein YdhG (YjbR/CyaY superfamily)